MHFDTILQVCYNNYLHIIQYIICINIPDSLASGLKGLALTKSSLSHIYGCVSNEIMNEFTFVYKR